MLRIFAVDATAEARGTLVDTLHLLLDSAGPSLEILPRIDIRPRSLEEIRFQEAPELCVIGPALLGSQLATVGTIRSKLPESALIACFRTESSDLSIIEQLGRYGIDDTMTLAIQPAEFLRKLVLLSRRGKKSKGGKLIVVDSGKGGVGVTTIAAALADALVTKEHSVTLIDFDTEAQSLSRFFQCRPFLNENLQLLFERQRPVSEEFVEQSLITLWQQGRGSLSCLTPIPDDDRLYADGGSYSRVLLSILEVLDGRSDFVVVDVGSARGALLRTFYRAADRVVFVISNDPAALYASTDRFKKMRSCLAAGSEAILISNAPSSRGLSAPSLLNEFNRVVGARSEDWVPSPLSYCAAGQRWPGSGGTLYSQGGRLARMAIDSLLWKLGVETASTISLQCKEPNVFLKAGRALLSVRRPVVIQAKPPQAPLPAALPEPARLLTAPVAQKPAHSDSEEAKLLISPAVIT